MKKSVFRDKIALMRIIKKDIDLTATKLFIKEKGKEIARAYLCILSNDLHEKPFGYVEDVFVAKLHRGQGLGTKIVEAVIEEAKTYECYKLVACSRDGREKLHNLYKKIGFAEHGKEFRISF